MEESFWRILHPLVTSSWFTAIPPLGWHLVAIGFWLGVVFLLAEWLSHRSGSDSELVRKVVHIGVGNVILLAWWFQIPLWLGVGASFLFSGLTLASYYVPILASINSVGRKSLGTFFYTISFGLLIGWFWTIGEPQYAVLGILVMTWGDGLAAIVGQRFGKHPYKLWGVQKSWEGSLTMAAASFGVSSLLLLSTQGFQWQTVLISLIVAVTATGLEAFSKFGIDNLTVPVVSAALSYGLQQIL